MVAINRIKGMAGDRKFIDHYYQYSDLKTKRPSPEINIEQCRKESCEQYLAALIHYINKTDKLGIGDVKRSYLDWARWNKLLIVAELRYFREKYACYGEEIEIITAKLLSLLEKNFGFNEADKCISNEYAHAFAQIERKEQNFENVSRRRVEQAARLLINYITLLTRKFFTKTFDRDDYSHERLQSEVDYLETSLRRLDNDELADSIKEAYDGFIEFCGIDIEAVAEQDKLMKIALEAAHERATESFLQYVIRQIQERIKQLEEAALERINQLLSDAKITSGPLNYISSFINFIKNPIKTTVEIIKFAKENPWKLAGIVLGGVVVGMCAGLVGVAGIAILDASLMGGAIPMIGSGLSCAIAGTIASVRLSVKNEIEKIKKETEEKIAEENAKIAAVKKENEKEKDRIMDETIYNKIRRDSLENTEEEIRKLQNFMQNVRRETGEQFNSMSTEELQAVEKELSSASNELTKELQAIQEKSKIHDRKMVEIDKSVSKLNDRRAAAEKRVQNAQKRKP